MSTISPIYKRNDNLPSNKKNLTMIETIVIDDSPIKGDNRTIDNSISVEERNTHAGHSVVIGERTKGYNEKDANVATNIVSSPESETRSQAFIKKSRTLGHSTVGFSVNDTIVKSNRRSPKTSVVKEHFSPVISVAGSILKSPNPSKENKVGVNSKETNQKDTISTKTEKMDIQRKEEDDLDFEKIVARKLIEGRKRKLNTTKADKAICSLEKSHADISSPQQVPLQNKFSSSDKGKTLISNSSFSIMSENDKGKNEVVHVDNSDNSDHEKQARKDLSKGIGRKLEKMRKASQWNTPRSKLGKTTSSIENSQCYVANFEKKATSLESPSSKNKHQNGTVQSKDNFIDFENQVTQEFPNKKDRKSRIVAAKECFTPDRSNVVHYDAECKEIRESSPKCSPSSKIKANKKVGESCKEEKEKLVTGNTEKENGNIAFEKLVAQKLAKSAHKLAARKREMIQGFGKTNNESLSSLDDANITSLVCQSTIDDTGRSNGIDLGKSDRKECVTPRRESGPNKMSLANKVSSKQCSVNINSEEVFALLNFEASKPIAQADIYPHENSHIFMKEPIVIIEPLQLDTDTIDSTKDKVFDLLHSPISEENSSLSPSKKRHSDKDDLRGGQKFTTKTPPSSQEKLTPSTKAHKSKQLNRSGSTEGKILTSTVLSTSQEKAVFASTEHHKGHSTKNDTTGGKRLISTLLPSSKEKSLLASTEHKKRGCKENDSTVDKKFVSSLLPTSEGHLISATTEHKKRDSDLCYNKTSTYNSLHSMYTENCPTKENVVPNYVKAAAINVNNSNECYDLNDDDGDDDCQIIAVTTTKSLHNLNSMSEVGSNREMGTLESKVVKSVSRNASDTKLEKKKSRKMKLRILEKELERMEIRINQFAEKELSLLDMESEESFYIKEAELKERFVKKYKLYCKLCDADSETVLSKKKIKVTGSPFPEMNRAVQKYVNNMKVFPDLFDVRQICIQTNDKLDLGIKIHDIQSIAIDIFSEVGQKLKSIRRKDHQLHWGNTLTDKVKLEEDPALHNQDLQRQLKNNRKIAKHNINHIFKDFVRQQFEQSQMGSNDISTESDSEPLSSREPLQNEKKSKERTTMKHKYTSKKNDVDSTKKKKRQKTVICVSVEQTTTENADLVIPQPITLATSLPTCLKPRVSESIPASSDSPLSRYKMSTSGERTSNTMISKQPEPETSESFRSSVCYQSPLDTFRNKRKRIEDSSEHSPAKKLSTADLQSNESCAQSKESVQALKTDQFVIISDDED